EGLEGHLLQHFLPARRHRSSGETGNALVISHIEKERSDRYAGQASSARRLIAAPHVHVIQTRSPSTPPSSSPQYWCLVKKAERSSKSITSPSARAGP